MKRHVAASLLGILGLVILDSHVNWVAHDHGTLLEVSGQLFDPQGWASDQWLQWHRNCRDASGQSLQADVPAIVQTIQKHSIPDSLTAQLLQLRVHADWAMAEVTFPTLNPSIVVLQRVKGNWQIQDRAVWSGSTAPWHPGTLVRRYLRQQAPELPETLLSCFAIDLNRYGQGPGGLGPVDLKTTDRP